MRRTTNAILLALGVLLAPAYASGQAAPKAPAAAAPKPLADALSGMAKAEYEAAKILYQDKDFANALIKFQRAYELSSEPRLLWNVAVCEKALRRYTRVIAALHKLRESGSEQDRKDADELVKTVEAFVSPLRVVGGEPGAEVFVDDEKVGTLPLRELVLVDVGSRRVRIVRPGFKELTEAVDVAGGTDVIVRVKLEREVHKGQLVVSAGADDLIVIDGKAVGRARFQGALASGGHTLKVTAPGMTAYQSEVVIQDGQKRDIQVTLNREAGSGLATWLWVAGGAALVAGAIVGGVVLSRSPEPSALGTLEPRTVVTSFGGAR